MLNDNLSNALSKILNAERVSKRKCLIRSSKVIKKVLDIMRENNYIGSYEEKKDNTGTMLLVNLIGNINKCGAIKPRFPVGVEEFEKFEKRYLIAKGFGIIIISTSKGIMTLEEAKKKKIGGKLLAYCY
ncbi:MAG: 30S ribosomal protein S8 [Candidatus Woesearchaeota archaeon]|nr:30S ribosomal protein S8 [Candidatus Woesearchaeota archaeon]